ncbi:pilus assembly protein CpaD [Rhizobium leguminosarum bv. viciae]|uniref:CpaD family pilus assembly protein n=1 Tax=Rhizobium leguminosarum TaxID=384 RepID=UPI00103C0423|nr:CpaD family pilus assembly protein [Rhizobium leguminosarum]NKJ90717.1 pilus assembly protein CpaD [Rhizobium leguminosarum bv. viciae]QIO59114.1 CpaD family pilus assembly lipoprotein [Rhizobium leguminosarum bv. trifolii]TBZ72839.1 pilus assembly protein CpaD [Rhizobium leguminosarum bv. viciae]
MSGARSAAMAENRDQAMAHMNSTTPHLGISKTLLAAAAISVAVLSGCAGPHDQLTTGGIPDDYRARHPIIVTEAEQTVDIPVASTDRRLTIAQRDLIRGFAANYISRASGPVYVLSPQGSPNSAAAYQLRNQVRAELASRGIASSKIVNTSYAAAGAGDAAPIRLSFTGTTAITTQCGQWPKDISNDLTNQNYYNFGCASQNNLAAQIANPEDLVAPRGMTPIDAQRRNNAIQEYRTTTSTIEDVADSNSGF